MPRTTQVKRRLRKDIADRDRRIDDLSATIEQHQDATAALRLRFQCVEQQLANQEARSRDLLTLVEERTAAMEENAGQLAELRSTNLELQLYMKELQRNAGKAGAGGVGSWPRSLLADCGEPESCDASIDYADGACSAENSPQTAPTTPDNLGSTVVDMRLREQQLRNQQLEAQLGRQTEDAAAALAEQAEQHAAEVLAAITELRATRADNQRLSAERRAQDEKHMHALSEAAQRLSAEHAEQCVRWQRDRATADAETADLLAQVTRLNALNADLMRQIGERDVRLEAMSVEGDVLVGRREELAAELAAVQRCEQEVRDSLAEHVRVRTEMEADRGRLEETVRGLRTQVDILETAQGTLRAETNEGLQQLQQVRDARQQMETALRRAEAKVAEVLEEHGKLVESQTELKESAEAAERVRQHLEGMLTWSLSLFVRESQTHVSVLCSTSRNNFPENLQRRVHSPERQPPGRMCSAA